MILLYTLNFINHKKHPLTQNFASNRMPTLRCASKELGTSTESITTIG